MSPGTSESVETGQPNQIYNAGADSDSSFPLLGEIKIEATVKDEMDESTPAAPSSSVAESASGALQLDGLASDATTESDALTQIIHGVEVDVRAVYMAFEQFTQAELVYLLTSQCGLSTDFVLDNCKTTGQMIDWLIQNLPLF